MNRLIIIGASGHGKVLADIAVKTGYEDIVFLDDDEEKIECAGYPVVGRSSDALHMDGDKIVAIGDAHIRKHFLQSLKNVVTLIHPKASISRRVKIGMGSVVMAGAVINSDAQIGNGCIINTGASVDHDCRIGDYCHISVGSHVAGSVEIGDSTWIGAGATVSNDIRICSNCTIGAGAVVINNIEEEGVYIGVPAKHMSKARLTRGGIEQIAR